MFACFDSAFIVSIQPRIWGFAYRDAPEYVIEIFTVIVLASLIPSVFFVGTIETSPSITAPSAAGYFGNNDAESEPLCVRSGAILGFFLEISY